MTATQKELVVKFSEDDAIEASLSWGANCGPGAVAAILGLSLKEVRPLLGDFEQRGYTNPTMMYSILNQAGVHWKKVSPRSWPDFGIARIQWEGPWTEPGVPPRARYRYTHWVGAASAAEKTEIFDINALSVGGWIPVDEWAGQLVPWLLRECHPRANGRWHITHSLEVKK